MRITAMTQENCHLLDRTESQYLDGESVVLHMTHSGFSLDFRPKKRAQWREPLPALQNRPAPEALLKPGAGAAFLALADDGPEVLGQVIAMPHANRLARVCDVRVRMPQRRQGIGRALLQAAERWAWQQGYVGLLFETPDDNPGACQFIQRCGFRLGGVDQLRYAGLPGRIGGADMLCEACLSFYKHFT